MGRKERRDRAKRLMERVDLADRAHHYPSELSGGQQQRVAIARALANDPSILIADEMTGDLDSETGFAIMELASNLNEEGMTIVYVTHDPRMAAFASRVIEIRDGKILRESSTAERFAGDGLTLAKVPPADNTPDGGTPIEEAET